MRGFGFGLRLQPRPLFRGPVATFFPLQIAGSRGEINAIEGGAITTSNQRHLARTRNYIGTQDLSELRIGFNGFFVDAATAGNFQTCLELNSTSSYILRIALEINGVVRRLTFDNGLLEKVVNPGDLLVMTDAVLPALFGLLKFPKQQEIWIRAEREFAVGAKAMFHQTASNSPAIAGETYFVGTTASTSRLTEVGALSTTGGWTQQAHCWLPYAVLGRPTSKMLAYATFGASIENGVGDGQGDGLNGAGGYMRRMLANVNGKKVARIHLAKSGETIKSWVNNSAKRRYMLQYTNRVASGHGGNDYSTGETLADTKVRWSQAWALMHAYGNLVDHYALSPKTNSVDWLDLPGQTPRSGFEAGGAWRDAGNDWCLSRVGIEIDGFRNLGSVQTDPTAPDKWRTDLGKPTTDGTHPASIIANAMAVENQYYIEQQLLAYETN